MEVTEANRVAEVEIALYCCRHAVEEKSPSESEERKKKVNQSKGRRYQGK